MLHTFPDAVARSSKQLASFRTPWNPNVESLFTFTSPDVLGLMKTTYMPSSSNFDNLVKLVAEVKVQSFSDKTLRVKLDHARFYSNGNEISLIDAHRLMETVMPHGISLGHTEQEFKKFLMEPMLVYTKRGLIKKLLVSQNEPTEVTEIKKSLASQLEKKKGQTGLQLIKKQAIGTPLDTPGLLMKVDLGNDKESYI